MPRPPLRSLLLGRRTLPRYAMEQSDRVWLSSGIQGAALRNMMQYFLRGRIGRRSCVPITGGEFHEIQRAKETLSHFRDLTESYRVVVETYRTVERKKHDAELDRILYSKDFYRSSLDVAVILNSAIMAYLASARHFLDSTAKRLASLLDADSVEVYERLRKGMHHNNVEYRFIEALRNYVQHKSRPIHVLTYHDFMEDTENMSDSDLVTCLSVEAKRDTLLEDKNFTAAERATLEGLPDAIDIIACMRFHMGGMWRLHNHLVTEHASLAQTAREQIAASIQRFVSATKDTPVGLEATAEDSDSLACDRIPLLLDWDDARIAAINELGDLTNLHKRYISGKIQRDGRPKRLPQAEKPNQDTDTSHSP